MKNQFVICGSSGSIGSAILKAFTNKEYTIIKVGRSDSDDIWVDFSIPESIVVAKQITSIDVIVFAQGINPTFNLKETSTKHFQEMLNINIVSPALFLKEHLNVLNKNSCVIFLSSIAANNGSYDPAYAAAKSGIRGLMKSLSRENPEVRFNSIILGLINESRVHNNMTLDFVEKHRDNMFGRNLIELDQVIHTIQFIIDNNNLSNTEISLTGGI